MFKYTPIIIFSYNRKTKLNNLIKSLKKNKEYKYSKVYIYQDFYKPKENERNIKKVNNTIISLKKIKEKNVKIVFRKKNFGLAKNIILGVTEIIKIHKRAIILEDDLIVSKFFLNYMNKALSFYQNKKKIFHINGWSFDLNLEKNLKYNNYFLKLPSSWGWATWADRWKFFEKNPELIIKNWSALKVKKFNFDNNFNFFSQIERNRSNKLNSWAIFWYAVIFEKEKLCVYPKHSYVSNTGFDSNATNTKKKINLFKSRLKEKNKISYLQFDKNLKENNKIVKEIIRKMKLEKKYSLFKKIINYLKLLY